MTTDNGQLHGPWRIAPGPINNQKGIKMMNGYGYGMGYGGIGMILVVVLVVLGILVALKYLRK